MRITNLLVLFLLCLTSCHHFHSKDDKKFDKAKWATKEDNSYPYRNGMLKDLLSSHDTLHGLKLAEVVDLLGQPNRTDSNFIFYNVDKTSVGGVFTLHTKTLVIKFNEDSTVNWTRIHE